MYDVSEEPTKASRLTSSESRHHDSENWTPQKKRKRKAQLQKFDLLTFCNIVLQYEKYDTTKQEDLRQNSKSPLDSNGSTADSFSSESTVSCDITEEEDEENCFDMSVEKVRATDDAVVPSATASPQTLLPSPSEKQKSSSTRTTILTTPGADEEDNSITCFCMKPYGGRPMIQCEPCARWIHYSCAKIRKNKIPDVFVCQQCKDSTAAKRKSNRMSPPSQAEFVACSRLS